MGKSPRNSQMKCALGRALNGQNSWSLLLKQSFCYHWRSECEVGTKLG